MFRLNPLSIPKGVKLNCEVCGKPAKLQCAGCRVSYYCCEQHQSDDWDGIHNKICKALIPLRTPPAFLGSEEERKDREKEIRQRQLALLEVTRTEASKHLYENNFSHAIPAALQALRWSLTIYGHDAIEAVPAYLLLSQASVGLKTYAQAEEYLSLARWAAVNHPDSGPNVKSKLYRNFGKLYSAQGRYDLALQQLALDLYHTSLSFGPSGVEAAAAHVDLSLVFEKTNKIDAALASLEKVLDAWVGLFSKHLDSDEELPLTDAQEPEAIHALSRVREVRYKVLGPEHAKTSEADAGLGLAYASFAHYDESRPLLQQAVSSASAALGAEHPTTVMYQGWLESMESAAAEESEAG